MMMILISHFINNMNMKVLVNSVIIDFNTYLFAFTCVYVLLREM